MLLRSGIATFSLLMLALTLPVRAQEWSEDQVIQRTADPRLQQVVDAA